MAKFEIALDSQAYPCDVWETVQQGERLVRVWEGFPRGLSQFQNRDPGRYRAAKHTDTTAPPYVRLPITASGADSLTLANFDDDLPVFSFQAESADGSIFFYVLNGQRAFKIDRDAGTLEATTDFGAGAVCGRPAWFESSIRIPLAGSVDSVKLATPANTGADTFTTETGIKALHFATIQDQSTAKIARAHSTNLVALSEDGTDYAAGFEVGDSTLPISDLLTPSGELMVIKPDGPYRFDADGNSLPIQGFVGKTKDTGVYTGAMSAAHGPFVYWVNSAGFHRIFGDSILPVGFESAREYIFDTTFMIGAFSPTTDAWVSAIAWGRWLYATRGSGVFAGYIEEDGTLTWHGALFNTDGTAHVLLDDGPGLNINGISGTSTALSRFPLTPDGSFTHEIDNQNRGKASLDIDMLYGFEDFGLPDRQKQLRRAWLITEGMPGAGTASWTIQVVRDASATLESIGAAITTNGTIERAPTVGTNDLFYQLSPFAAGATTAGYSSTSNDPRYRQLGVEARTADVIRAVIPLRKNETEGLSGGVKGSLIALRRLQSGQRIAIRDPYFNSTFNGYVSAIRETALGEGNYSVELFLERFDIA